VSKAKPPGSEAKARPRAPKASGKTALPGVTRNLQEELRAAAALAELCGPLISPATSVAAMAALVLVQARRLTGSEHGYVATIDPVTGDLVAHTLTEMLEGQCLVSGAERRIVFPRSPDGHYPGLWGHALNTRTPFFTNAPEGHPSSRGGPPDHIPLTRFLAVPVLLGDQLVGQIALANAMVAYTEADLAFVGRLAEIFALAIHRTRSEEALRKSQAWLQSIFRAAPTGIGLVRNRVLQWANETLCRMLGYTEEELIGQSARMLYPTDDDFARVGEEKYAQIRAGGRGTVETRWQRKDQVVRDVLLSSTPLDPADWSVGVIFTALDITDRKRTEAELRMRTEQLEALRATTADITGELELATVLHLVVRRACELTGATAADIFLWDADRQLLVSEASYGHELNHQATTRRLGEGAMGMVAQTRRGVLIHDYRSSPIAHPDTLAHTKITASVVEPLLYRDTLLGVIGVDHEAPGRTFTDHDQAALRLFAAHAAIAIQNARLYETAQRELRQREAAEATLRRSMGQLEAVRATTADITRELDLDRLLQLITTRAAALLGLTHGVVHLWDEPSQILVTRAVTGYDAWRHDVTLRLGEGVAGTVAQRRTALIENDYRTSPLAARIFLEHSTTTAMLAAPLLYRERLLGVLAVTDDGAAHRFAEHDLELLGLFADQAAIAIENARLYGEAEQRRREAEVLAALAKSITASLDLSTVLQRVADGANGLCDGDLAAIALREGDTLVFRTWAGMATPTYISLRIGMGQGLGGKVLEQGRPIRTANYREDPAISNDFHDVALAEQFVAEIAVPIRIEDAVAGVLFVIRRTARPFTAADEAILTRLADQAAIAIANARLFQNQQQAYRELEQAQEELVRSEKLRGLGQMAAGIAHDLNNTLATILGQAELLRLRARQPEMRDGLQTLLTATTDGAQVVRRLQDFARQRGSGPLTPCSLSELVAETIEITRPRWREEPRRRGVVIEVSVDLAGLPPVQGNPAEIREVLTNLIFNAVDAMPSGGSLRFTGRVCDEAATHRPEGSSDNRAGATPGPAEPPQWVEVAVSDTGIGMTDDVRRRVFDPFFTTKGLHGTGLGLSAVYGIVERHGGQIDVTSSPGKGATFRLRFRPAAEVAQPPFRVTPSVLPSRRILLVDDDAAVRQTLAALLRASGQEVIEADSGAAAVDWLASAQVDLVLTDLGMPQVTGWDVARAAKARRPDLPVVLLTGWGDQTEAETSADAGVDRVLTKPVPRSTVLTAIAELTGPR
jgi:PAS domain S-box-containing protein